MPKSNPSKPSKPTSMRLSPQSMSAIQDLALNTGWSASRVVEHLVQIGWAVYSDNPAAAKLLKHIIHVAWVSHAKTKKAAEIAKAAKRDLQTAVDAAKAKK